MTKGEKSDSITISKRTLGIAGGITGFVIFCVVLALVFAGGDDDAATPNQGHEGASGSAQDGVPTITESAEASTPGNCEEQGITFEGGQEGTCFDSEAGAEYTVVNQGNRLVLPGLTVKLLGIEFTDSLSGSFESIQADEQFVLFRLEVRNTSKSPQTFDSSGDQALLATNDREFSEDFDAQNGPEESSFLWQAEEIQPGGRQTGTLVFDVPRKSAKKIGTDGNLLIGPFGTNFSFGTPKTVGVIRTYK